MSRADTRNPAQESLFLSVPATAEEIPITLTEPTQVAEVSLIERNLHLQNVLQLLHGASGLAGFSEAVHTPDGSERIEHKYGRMTSRVVAGAESNRDQLMKNAKWEFARAFGLFALQESGIELATEPKQLARESFRTFLGRYGMGGDRYRSRETYRRSLAQTLEDMKTSVTLHNREAGLRPHKIPKGPEKLPSPQERLQALGDDPRAGFIPTTHREKNQVLTFLDYLDNPEFPLGINNQFREVFHHAQTISRTSMPGNRETLRGMASGTRALQSIVYEIGDYYADAVTQEAALRQLEQGISECPNPHVTLLDEIGETNPGYAPLIRHLDLQELRTAGSVAALGLADPLSTREKRWKRTGPGKHKAVQDNYTATEMKPEFSEHIAQRVGSLKIGELRAVISEAITDQIKRSRFMEQRLAELQMPADRPGHRAAWQVAQKILADTH